MNKSILLTIIAFLSGLSLYLLLNREKPLSPQKNGTNTEGVKAIDRPWKSPNPDKGKVNGEGKLTSKSIHPALSMDPQELTDEEIAEFEEYFEEVEKNWSMRMETLFVGEFSLGEEALEKYMNMRDAYEEEKMIAFQEFHEFMVSKYGENYSYKPPEDMEAFENKVYGIYIEKMKNFLGEDHFNRYQEVKTEFNERLKREQNPDRGVILIEI